MESIISDLVARFEKGSLSRRQLVSGLAMLAASGTAAAAADDVDFTGATIDHVSIHAADLQRSIDFYQRMFGFKVVSQDKPREIVRLGSKSMLVSLNHGVPAGIVDHFAIGIAAVQQSGCGRPSAAARCDTTAGRLCRAARQGSRRNQCADHPRG